MTDDNRIDLDEKILGVKYGEMSYYRFNSETNPLTILFIHGSGGGKEWFQEQFKLNSLDVCSWLVPSLFGYDDQEKPMNAEAYTMEQFAEDLYYLLIEENVSDLIIIGHSMGGQIGVLLNEIIWKQANSHSINLLAFYNCEGPLTISELTKEDMAIGKSPFEEYKVEFEREVLAFLEKNDEASKRGLSAYKRMGAFLIWAVFKSFTELLEKENLSRRMIESKKGLGYANFLVVGDENNKKLPSIQFYEKNEIIVIPDAGHIMMMDNPTIFWDVLVKSNSHINRE